LADVSDFADWARGIELNELMLRPIKTLAIKEILNGKCAFKT
jgi:hypothetical protein